MKTSKKEYIYVCISILSNRVAEISATSEKQAKYLFKKYNEYNADIVKGPFLKVQESLNDVEIIFSSRTIKGKYKGWEVSARILQKPENYCFLFFEKKIDDCPKPKNNLVELQEIEVL